MNVKNGFSTLNRLLGKKNKGNNLSKSSTNLTLTTQNNDPNIALSSHLEQNRITPLPIATSNAPFEQTFRITVLLPRDQLYVARLGAKTKLEKLLELVCENKQLDPKKYEFRHPIDTSQVFSCELTIGAVGLSEIRLCHKSEGYDNFNADEIIKLRHTGRESVSSSEFSSRNSKHTLKTASPYSSTNSLNSVDSAGMSTNYRGPVLSLPPLPPLGNKTTTTSSHNPPIAPARKKRVAPRPPSQNSIPEQEIISTLNEFKDKPEEFKLPLPRKDFHVSTPNLAPNSELTVLRSTDFHQSNVSIDCNGNTKSSINGNIKTNGHIHFNGSESSEFKTPIAKARPSSMHISGSGVSLNTTETRPSLECTPHASNESVKMPEPVPRKRIITVKKKAPAPPPRSFPPPVASPRHTATSLEVGEKVDDVGAKRSPQENGDIYKFNENKRNDFPKDTAKEITSTKDTEDLTTEKLVKRIETEFKEVVNETPALAKETPSARNGNSPDSQYPASLEFCVQQPQIIEDSSFKASELQSKESTEGSSDEEEQLKVYNLKLGKTIVKTLVEPQTVKDLSTATTPNPEMSPIADTAVISDASSLSSTSHGWTYTIPAPPTFADSPSLPVEETHSAEENLNNEDTHKPEESSIDSSISFNYSKTPDPPITPIIKETPPVDFEIFNEITPSITKVVDKEETHENAITSDIEDGYHGNQNVVELEPNRDSPGLKDKEMKRTEEIRVDSSFKGFSEEFINDEYGRTKNSVSPTSLESFDSNKTDVITELNNVITENKIETIIKTAEGDEEIKSSKACVLANFKIQAYNKVPGPVKTLNTDSSSKCELGPNVKEMKTARNDEDSHEKLYKKRLSLTLNSSSVTQILNKTTRPNVTRSDSFHFTRYPNNNTIDVDDNSLLSSRSSSYRSLLNAQKINNDRFKSNESLTNATRRKSSSELSIGESPSLQSLIVMKSILNSRKNSFSNDLSSETNSKNINGCVDYNENKNINVPNTTVENNNRKNAENDDCDSSKENSPKNKLLSQDITSVERSEKTSNEPERKWKYQGPPSINLSTWSERPKIQVSIKDDCDYKFGRGSVFNTPVRTLPLAGGNGNSVTSTCIGSGTEATTATVSSIIPSENVRTTRPKVPFVRSVEYKRITSALQASANDESSPKSSTTYPRPLSAGNTMTLGRMPKINRNPSFVPTVKGFRNVENTDSFQKFTLSQNDVTNNYNDGDMNVIKSSKTQSNGFEKNNSIIGRHILTLSTQNNVQSSNSFNNTSNIKPYLDDKLPEKPKPENIPLFAQVTLRKTGLKEKILTPQLEEAETPSPVPLQRNEKSNCAKLELKLTTTKSTDVLKQSQPNFEAPPPPPPPIILSVVTKSVAGTKPTQTEDPRDQLLNAIRNFSKDSLKHS